jgi:hypothetical protein
MIEYLNEGTIIHSKIGYVLQRGKRNYFEIENHHTATNGDSWFEFEATVYPPLMLLPVTWQRYEYTIQDIASTYDKIDSHLIWILALMLLCGQYEPEAASAGVRPTFQSLFTFLFISRKTIFDVFVAAHTSYIVSNNNPLVSVPSILCHERPDHKPLLPKIMIESDSFRDIQNMVPNKHPSFCWVQKYEKAVPFKDIWLVPVEYDEYHKLIYMVRIVTKAVYEAITVKPKLCVVTLPIIVQIRKPNSQDYVEYVLLEEACFFAEKKLGQSIITTNITTTPNTTNTTTTRKFIENNTSHNDNSSSDNNNSNPKIKKKPNKSAASGKRKKQFPVEESPLSHKKRKTTKII